MCTHIRTNRTTCTVIRLTMSTISIPESTSVCLCTLSMDTINKTSRNIFIALCCVVFFFISLKLTDTSDTYPDVCIPIDKIILTHWNTNGGLPSSCLHRASTVSKHFFINQSDAHNYQNYRNVKKLKFLQSLRHVSVHLGTIIRELFRV